MNKVKIEKNSDDTYNVTLPDGGASLALSPKGVVDRLKSAEDDYQAALDDIKARRQDFENKSAGN